jgi:tRNA threonylcarbamoyladenosine biosynthesis protein TsaB
LYAERHLEIMLEAMEITVRSVMKEQPAEKLPRLLVIDTCGDVAVVGLCIGTRLEARDEMVARTASAKIIEAIRELLGQAGWHLDDMDAIGVVSGPGSFTGVRTGLATAKGLCEALGVPLIAVSRLEVLAAAAGPAEFVALEAGRGEFYVRSANPLGVPQEFLCGDEGLANLLTRSVLVVAEEHVRERLASRLGADSVKTHELEISDSIPLILAGLRSGEQDIALADANYVRSEQQIYSTASALPHRAAGARRQP